MHRGQPCIRCGDCQAVCPERLAPQLLLESLLAGDVVGAGQLGLADCTACARCDAVCPSGIDLAAVFLAANTARWQAAEQARAAQAAKSRYLQRQQRLLRETAEAEALRQAQGRTLQSSAAKVLARLRRDRGQVGSDDTPPTRP